MTTSCALAGNEYFSVIFFSLISLMFDGFAEETLTVSTRKSPCSKSHITMIPHAFLCCIPKNAVPALEAGNLAL